MATQKKNKTTKTPENTTPVVEAAPVVAAPVETAPVQKGGAKKAAKKAEPQVVATPAVEAAPVVETVVAAPAAKAKRAPAKKAVAPAATPSTTPAATPAVASAKGKKAAAKPKKAAVSKAEKPVAAAPAAEGEEDTDGRTRSFKVQLPNEQEFSGRFTGLTPYQAANKALSKFFRNNENTNLTADQVIFSIRESTRGSKRATYSYKGSRVKLETPITYTIKSADGQERVITKQYKNQLIKVKKGVAAEAAPAPATA
jgi:hypothetical protein